MKTIIGKAVGLSNILDSMGEEGIKELARGKVVEGLHRAAVSSGLMPS